MKKILFFILITLFSFAEAKENKIIFMGDSITDGNWGGGGDPDKRNKTDYNHIYGHGFMEMITGYYMSKCPEKGYVFQNRGISGYTLQDLKKRWQSDVIQQNPDVLSILVGTNDAGFYIRSGQKTDDAFEYAKWDSTYRSLLDDVIKVNPSVKIVLCSPFVVIPGDADTRTKWELRKTIVEKLTTIVEKIASDYNAVYVPFDRLFVDLYKKFEVSDNYWSWDGIHPTTAGHAKMAELWIKKVGKL